jgi:exonuclease VII large subunit
MKTAPLAFALLLLVAPALAETVSAADAAKHVGQTVTVEGLVSGVHTARSGSATFINMGGRYPNNAFTAVVFERDSAAVGDVSALDGRTIGVTGEIKLYQGKPEIVVKAKSQITVTPTAH